MANANAAKMITSGNGQDKAATTMQVVKGENGTASVAEVKNVVAGAEVSVPAAVPVPAPVPEVAPVPQLTLEQKIQKVYDLGLMIEKLNQLNDAKRNLQTFKISSDGLSIQLYLRDTANNREFKTVNTAVVSRIIEVISETLQGKIAEVEQQIRF